MSKKWLWFFVGGLVTVSAYGWPWSKPEPPKPDISKLVVQAYLVPAIDTKRGDYYSGWIPSNISVKKVRLQVTNGTDYYLEYIQANCTAYDRDGNRFTPPGVNGGFLLFKSEQGAIAPGNTSIFTSPFEEVAGEGSFDVTAIRVECKVVKASGSK